MSRHAPDDWRLFALCAEADPEAWSPTDSTPRHEREAAIAICRQCPSRIPCLEDALATHDRHTIRGGLTERERRPLLRARAS